jgi:uncharacterized protein YhfF
MYSRLGTPPELVDRLAMLLGEGVKTATCSALWTYEEGQEPLCLEEEIILSFSMETVFPSRLLKLFTCLSRPSTRSLSRLPTDEGEGDRSLAYGRQAHRNYFSRQQRFKNRAFDERILLYFPSWIFSLQMTRESHRLYRLLAGCVFCFIFRSSRLGRAPQIATQSRNIS